MIVRLSVTRFIFFALSHEVKIIRKKLSVYFESQHHHQPHPAHQPNSKLEAADHKADKAIEQIVELLKAA
jgi:hypothetical protein